MFIAILVSLLWLDSFYFILEFITHTSHLPIEIAVPLGPLMKNLFASVLAEIIRNACSLICCLIKVVTFLFIYF